MLSAGSVRCLLYLFFFLSINSLTHYRRFKPLSFFFHVNIHIKALSSILPLFPRFLFDFPHIPISHLLDYLIFPPPYTHSNYTLTLNSFYPIFFFLFFPSYPFFPTLISIPPYAISRLCLFPFFPPTYSILAHFVRSFLSVSKAITCISVLSYAIYQEYLI